MSEKNVTLSLVENPGISKRIQTNRLDTQYMIMYLDMRLAVQSPVYIFQ